MAMESRFTWMDGKLIPTEQATVPFLTSGLHYGFGAFEGIRCYDTANGPAVFRLPEHSERLVDSCRVFGLELPWTAEQITQACVEVVAANEFRECYLRPLAFTQGQGWNLSLLNVPVRLGIAAWQWNAYHGEHALERGLKANVSSYTRHHTNVMMTKAKISGNYANSALAKTESMRLGFDESIMLDPQGYVSECTGANLFLVRNGKIVTPPKTTILEGLTRDALITIAGDLGIEVREEMISRDQLYIADEVFVCGTAAEVSGLTSIDARQIGSGVTGPITRQLQKAFLAAVRGSDPRYYGWLTPVPADPAVPQVA